ncbi:Ubiquitin family protein [Aphelenchoides avenae]|nr:Ubiquitin family protein [Aphelenchus avenae]
MTINIKVKTLDGRDHQVTIDENAALSDLRAMLEGITSIPKERQRLIFRGRPLTDDSRSLNSYGVYDDYAIHLVDKPQPAPQPAGTSAEAAGDGDEHGRTHGEHGHRHPRVRVRNSNLIVGNIPVERSQVFTDPQNTLRMVNEAVSSLAADWNLASTVRLQENRPQQGDISVNVVLRGRQETAVDSPARERIEGIRAELKRLFLLLLTLKRVFHAHLEALSSTTDEPSQEDADRLIGAVVRSVCDAEELPLVEARNLYRTPEDEEALTGYDELDGWNFEEDDLHLERMQDDLIMRHASVDDFDRILGYYETVQDGIRAELRRYREAVRAQGSYLETSFGGRLLQGYIVAFARVLHRQSHVQHIVSDISVHLDAPSPRRLYPQYVSYERETPPEADLSILFHHPRNTNPANRRAFSGLPRGMRTGPPGLPPGFPMPPMPPMPFNGPPPENGSVSFSMGPNVEVRMDFRSVPVALNQDDNAQPAAQQANAGNGGGQATANPLASSSATSTTPAAANTATRSTSTSSATGQRSETDIGPTPLSGIANFAQQPQAAPPPPSQGPPPGAPQGYVNQPQQPMLGNRPPNARISFTTQGPLPPNALQGIMAHAMSMLGTTLGLAPPGSAPVNQNTPNGPARQPDRPNSAPPPGASTAPQQQDPGRDGHHHHTHPQQNWNPFGAHPANGPVGPQQGPDGDDRPGSPALVHSLPGVAWHQQSLSAAPNSLFVGPRPPTNFPLYTFDPFLTCSTRHYRPYDHETRLRYEPAPLEDGMDAEDEATREPTRSPRSQSPSNAPPPPPSVSVNNNGEARFSDEQEFVSFVSYTLGSIVANMAELSPQIASRPIPRRAYGFNPMYPGGRPVVQIGALPRPAFIERPADDHHDHQRHHEHAPAATVNPAPRPAGSHPSAGNNQGRPQVNPNDLSGLGRETMEVVTNVLRLAAQGNNRPLTEVLPREYFTDGSPDGRGFLLVLCELAITSLGVSDFAQLFSGNVEVLGRARNAMLRSMINMLDGNSRPSEEDIESIANRLSVSRDLLERVQTDSIRSVADGIDIIATAQAIDRLQLRQLLTLIFDRSATGDAFTSSLMDGICTYVRRMIGLARVATGTENGHETVLNRLMELDETNDQPIIGMVSGYAMQYLQDFVDRHLPDGISSAVEEVRPFFVRTTPPVVTTATATRNAPSTSHASTVQPHGPSSSAAGTSGDNSEASIRRVFPSDWADVIVEDMHRQQAQDLPAHHRFSDAYLLGVPPKRRRVLFSSGSSPGEMLSTALGECLDEAGTSSGIRLPEEMDLDLPAEASDILRSEMDRLIQDRVRNDPDMDAKKFPNAAKRFHP